MKRIIASVLSIIICSAGLIAIWHFTNIGVFSKNQAAKSEEYNIPDYRDKEEEELRRKIQTEIKFLFDHDWAGTYFLGDGLGNILLLLAPGSGYVLESHADIGSWALAYGAVSETNGRISLAVPHTNKKNFEARTKRMEGIAKEFFVIDWGSRRYLIPTDNMIGFCNAVNQGTEPRKSVFGSFLLRRGDEKIQVQGLPNIPEEFMSYLKNIKGLQIWK